MKLYVSYYGNYVSIVEGFYNVKKQKYVIKNFVTVHDEDVELDYRDKYSLLRYALSKHKFKSKKVVFSLNTRDVIIKSNTIQKISPKDLDGVMNNEIDEMMSLESDRYIFSYEVTREHNQNDEDVLDIILAGVATEEVQDVLSIFTQYGLTVEKIDTISTSYSRLMRDVVYEDIMMINIGRYGSIVNIYREDKLFMYDNIPVKVNDMVNYSVCLALVEEIRGLTNFYSSRNFGKSVDTMVFIGESYSEKQISETFKESFGSNIVSGIENLIDIEGDIQGNLKKGDVSKVVDILGSMIDIKGYSKYSTMNLLPEENKNKLKSMESVKKVLLVLPLAGIILATPYIGLDILNKNIQQDILTTQNELDNLMIEFKGITDIEKDIEINKEKLEIYESLISKNIKWESLLKSIDKNIPYTMDLTNIMVKYEPVVQDDESEDSLQEGTNTEEKNEDTSEDTENKDNVENTDDESTEMPIYDRIPNVMYIEGNARSHTHIGQFVYNLNKIEQIESVKLEETSENKEENIHSFKIFVSLKEGVE